MSARVISWLGRRQPEGSTTEKEKTACETEGEEGEGRREGGRGSRETGGRVRRENLDKTIELLVDFFKCPLPSVALRVGETV